MRFQTAARRRNLLGLPLLCALVAAALRPTESLKARLPTNVSDWRYRPDDDGLRFWDEARPGTYLHRSYCLFLSLFDICHPLSCLTLWCITAAQTCSGSTPPRRRASCARGCSATTSSSSARSSRSSTPASPFSSLAWAAPSWSRSARPPGPAARAEAALPCLGAERSRAGGPALAAFPAPRPSRSRRCHTDDPSHSATPHSPGGCFHSDYAALMSLTLKSRPRPGLCASGTGYAGKLMHQINATWPHPDHTFINAGVSGARPAPRLFALSRSRSSAPPVCCSSFPPSSPLSPNAYPPRRPPTRPSLRPLLRRQRLVLRGLPPEPPPRRPPPLRRRDDAREQPLGRRGRGFAARACVPAHAPPGARHRVGMGSSG